MALEQIVEPLVQQNPSFLAGLRKSLANPFVSFITAFLPAFTYGCGSAPADDGSSPACQSDYDCKGDHICVGGFCQDPEDDDPPVNMDKDRDGFKAVSYGGDDCDDNNPSINPSILDLCDGIDNNCNGLIDEWGCGNYVFNDRFYYTTSTGIYSFSLQNGTTKSIYSSEGAIVNFDISPNQQKIAYTNQRTKKSYIKSVDTHAGIMGVEIFTDYDIHPYGIGWVDNQTVVTVVMCPCGYDDFIGEAKLCSFNTSNSQAAILRPEVLMTEFLFITHDSNILGYESIRRPTPTERYFVYDYLGGSTQSLDSDLGNNPHFSSHDRSLIFFTYNYAIRSYDLDNDHVARIFSLNEAYNSHLQYVAGVFEDSSGKERLFYVDGNDSNLNLCSIFTDGTRNVCENSRDFLGVVPHHLKHLH